MVISFLILVGLIIGSFISVVTYRLPRGEGFVKGRSYCDNCGKQLLWFHNIPVFSYLVLKGKSACCNQRISLRYPLIELASAFGAVVLYFLFPFPSFAICYMLYAICLAIFIIDLEHQIIPDELCWLILLYALCFMPYGLGLTPYANLFTAFFSAFLLLTIHIITKGKGMGLGDVKLAIALGLWLTVEQSLYWLMTAFIIGGIVASILLLLKRARLKTKIAFGPFLIIAFWIILLYEQFY